MGNPSPSEKGHRVLERNLGFSIMGKEVGLLGTANEKFDTNCAKSQAHEKRKDR